MEFREVGELPINPRIVAQMAKATVKSLSTPQLSSLLIVMTAIDALRVKNLNLPVR